MMSRSTRSTGEASANGLVRRMASLPRNILGGFSRAMGMGGRRQNPPLLNPRFPVPHQYPPPLQKPAPVQEEWDFLANYEHQHGTAHPFFYTISFVEALQLAQDEHKFVFVYLHSPQQPLTTSFCRETLGSELVVQFLDANFVSWGAIANRGEGLNMANTLGPSSFPFCAVVAPAPGNSISVLRQMEGSISPAELVETLQRTIEEQGLAFGSGWAKEEEQRKADRRLREEQDAAYLQALQIDQERERPRDLSSEERMKRQEHPTRKQESRVTEANTSRETQPQATQILIRFPNGERKEQSFMSTDKVQAVYKFIDSQGLSGSGRYRLISSFPRKVLGVDQMGMTLKDAGLHPRASLFLELI